MISPLALPPRVMHPQSLPGRLVSTHTLRQERKDRDMGDTKGKEAPLSRTCLGISNLNTVDKAEIVYISLE